MKKLIGSNMGDNTLSQIHHNSAIRKVRLGVLVIDLACLKDFLQIVRVTNLEERVDLDDTIHI